MIYLAWFVAIVILVSTGWGRLFVIGIGWLAILVGFVASVTYIASTLFYSV